LTTQSNTHCACPYYSPSAKLPSWSIKIFKPYSSEIQPVPDPCAVRHYQPVVSSSACASTLLLVRFWGLKDVNPHKTKSKVQLYFQVSHSTVSLGTPMVILFCIHKDADRDIARSFQASQSGILKVLRLYNFCRTVLLSTVRALKHNLSNTPTQQAGTPTDEASPSAGDGASTRPVVGRLFLSL